MLAVGFVLLRVVYRVLFGGVGGPGPVVVELPQLRLAGPFSHVTLLGEITAVGLGNAALSALPVAAVILIFGLLNAVIDVRRFFARGAGRGPLRAISRSLVIAWGTFPALLDSVRRVRVARQLRGERGAAALLVPVFEQTIERALALAASMETRGLAAGHPLAIHPFPGDVAHPVTMTDASLTFDGPWRLEGLSIKLTPGTLTVIAGPTGSGKSSLLHSLSGLFQHFHEGSQGGRIEVAGVDRQLTPPRDTATVVGVVSQNVRLAFAAETVHDEIGFALAVRGAASALVHERVLEVAARLAIEYLLARPIEALSAGEATLVAIAAALVGRPTLLLVDEPLADLDDAARERVCGVLDGLAHGTREAPVCVVVAEHNTAEFARVADAWLDIQGSRVLVRTADDRPTTPAARPLPSGGESESVVPLRQPPLRTAIETAAGLGQPLVDIRGLSVQLGAQTVVDDVSLGIRSGEIVALRGPNGAGKSSLLQAMALPSGPGTVLIAGQDVQSLTRRTRRHLVALVPENVDDLLFSTTVREECRRADRTRRVTTPTIQVFARLLGREAGPTLAALLDRHPRDLSAGERLCLVIAIQLAVAPALLLVDEPTRGLDPQARTLVGAALTRAADSTGAVIVATHDHDFAARVATTTIRMEAARIVPVLVSH
ncbi:ATP-binding cassette domain-containing protein [Cryobacterium frigoriphilum]|uniref:ATP-binding cassette domain-containing protein n=1 Tax=Cryobacterium frigoriphilum TaxID=1259150 RepID=A0A4R9A869_9MICO|nr:ATP-binding cassette domain-containing protein [Cryobacterium frigoriphilum]TFD54010.1 ATP-binding cassette domain-containing protein [Cryobacterium frigoriphilum]